MLYTKAHVEKLVHLAFLKGQEAATKKILDEQTAKLAQNLLEFPSLRVTIQELNYNSPPSEGNKKQKPCHFESSLDVA